MDPFNIDRKPNKRAWALFFFVIIPELVIFFYYIYKGVKIGYAREMVVTEARCFAAVLGAAGSLYILILIGGEAFRSVTGRIAEFFRDLSSGIRLPQALRWYWDSMKREGCAFWILLLPLAANVILLIISLGDYAALPASRTPPPPLPPKQRPV